MEGNQRVEDMVNCEDDLIIMDGQNPFLLGFEPLRLFKRAALRTMAILAGFIVKLPFFALLVIA